MATPRVLIIEAGSGEQLAIGVPAPVAPEPEITLTAASPASGTVGEQSGDMTVAWTDLPAAITITPAVAPGPGTLSPASISAGPGSGSAALRLTPLAAAAHLVSLANDGGIANPPAVGYSASAAPSYATSLALSITGSTTTGATATVNITPNGPIAPGGGTATIAITSGGGTLGSTSVTLTAGSSGPFTTTISRSTDGTTALSLTNNIGLTNSPSTASYTTTTAAPAGSPAAFTLTSASSGTLPFAVGYALRQGDVPSGQDIAISGATAKASILSTWPDGSAKIALIAGTYTSTGAAVTVTPSAGTNAAGTALTGASVQTAMGANTAAFGCGSFGTVTFSGADFASPFKTHCATSAFGEFIYRKAVGSDAHLVAWIAVRLWASGAIEVLPWLENGYLNVASPTSKSATYSFTLGGTSRFSAAIDLPAHCRTPLVSGSALSHWLGTDPGVTVQHDADYLMATRLVPSYGATVAADAARVAALPSTFTPLQLGNFDAAMGAAGYQPAIGLLPEWDVLLLTATTSAAPWAGVQRNAYSAGRWNIHFRDETTNRPIRFSAYSNLVAHTNVGASTTGTYTPTPTGTAAPEWDIPHHPSVGYLAYLITGRWYHMETVMFAATRNFLHQPDAARQTTAGIFRASSGAATLRGAAWAIRTLAQAATVVPDADATLRAEFVASLESNIDWNHTRYVAQPNNPFGFVESYGDNSTVSDGRWVLPTWQHDFHTMAWGYALALNPSVTSPARTQLREFFHWTAQSVVGRFGGTTSDQWLYRDAVPYLMTVAATDSPDWATGTGPWPASWGAMYDLSFDGSTYAEASPGSRVMGDLRGASIPDATNRWANVQPALAYAVEHGVSGAAQARERMLSASNWPALSSNFNTDPVWSVKPRTPAWLRPLAVGQWVELQDTKLSDMPGINSGVRSGKQDAWCGHHMDPSTSTAYTAAQGGHDDYHGNEVQGVDLTADVPAWATVVGSSLSSAVTLASDYYSDGKPASQHGYHTAIMSPHLNKLLRFPGGSRATGGTPSPLITAFDLTTRKWDTAATWTPPSYSIGGGDGSFAIHPATGKVYCYFYNALLAEWDPANPTVYTDKITSPPNPAVHYTAAAVCPTVGSGGTAFYFGGGSTTMCRAYDIAANSLRTITLSGTDISASATGCAMQWVGGDVQAYVVRLNETSGGGTLYKITPNSGSTWPCEAVATTGGASLPGTDGASARFPFTKGLYAPALGVFIYSPVWGSNVWACKLHEV